MAATPQTAARQLRALNLRLSGLSWDQIAAEMRRAQPERQLPGEPASYTAKRAAADGRAALKAAQALIGGPDAKDLARTLELARLDMAWMTVETIMRQAVQASDRWLALRSVDRLLRVSAQRDALQGLSLDAEVPPSPEADLTDDLSARREKRLREAAGQP